MRRVLLLTLFWAFCLAGLVGCGGAEPTQEQSTKPRAPRVPQK